MMMRQKSATLVAENENHQKIHHQRARDPKNQEWLYQATFIRQEWPSAERIFI